MDQGQTAPAANKLLGAGLGAVISALGLLVFYGAYHLVSHRGPIVQAAKLGSVERHDTPWIVALIGVLFLVFAVALAAFGYGHRLAISRIWRRRMMAAALVAALSPGILYGAVAGWRVAYTNSSERGVVTPKGVTHYPWTAVSQTEISCAVEGGKRPDVALITFKVAFPDGEGDDFSFQLHRGVPGEMLDWDLWIAYQIRKTYFDDPNRLKPVITLDPLCAWYFTVAATPEVRDKLNQLFAPVTSRRIAR